MIKKILIRVVTLLIVFVAAVFGIGKYINKDTPDTTEAMRIATLPLVYMLNDETQMNRLHGYVKEMEITAMRDALTPIDSDRKLNIQIQPYQNKVTGVEFEVLTSDGKKSMENTKVTKISEDENYVTATLEFQNKILMNTEYMLKIALTVGGREVYYYTRIIREDGLKAPEYLDFVMGFYESCINGKPKNIEEVMGPESNQADNTTLAYSNIHNNLNDNIIWKTLEPEVYYKPTPCIRELNQTTATIVMDYMISATDEDGNVELYNVSEYFRLRYTETRIYLLDFEREMNEMFNPENNIMTEKGIKLGITGKNITYKNDIKNNYFAFVQQGALWSYDSGSNKITQIFSFPQERNSDARDMYDQNDIEIISIDEAGNIYFLVCGYMNRGNHEGESGVAVYYYEEASSTVGECLFVDTKHAYSLLRQDVQTLAYISEDKNSFYMVLDGNVYGINMETRQVESIVSGLKVGCYTGSRSGKWFAWVKENDLYNSSTIQIIDLDTREMTEVASPGGQKLRVLGFIEEDLVYGLAKDGDIDTAYPGNELFPMSEIRIVDSEGQTIKNYEPKNSFVFDAVFEDKMVTLLRKEYTGGRYQDIEEDHIVSSTADQESSYGISSVTSTRKKTETVLGIGESLSAVGTPQVVKSRQIIYEGSKEIALETNPRDESLYYVYAKGSLDSMHTSVNLAVQRADEALGVVVNGKQQVVWERGNKKEKLDLDVNTFPAAFLEYSLDVQAIQSKMDQTVLDLSGCTMEQILYFVSQGTPVLAKTADGVVIIGGYDEYNTRLLRPGSEKLEYYGREDSTAMFEEAGSVFITYLNPLTE